MLRAHATWSTWAPFQHVDAGAWLDELEQRAADGVFFCALLALIVADRKPAA